MNNSHIETIGLLKGIVSPKSTNCFFDFTDCQGSGCWNCGPVHSGSTLNGTSGGNYPTNNAVDRDTGIVGKSFHCSFHHIAEAGVSQNIRNGDRCIVLGGGTRHISSRHRHSGGGNTLALSCGYQRKIRPLSPVNLSCSITSLALWNLAIQLAELFVNQFALSDSQKQLIVISVLNRLRDCSGC